MQTKFFVADDKFGDVIRCLEARGWTRYPHLSFPKFQLKWVNYSKIPWSSRATIARIQETQMLNHFQHAVLFSQKDVFAHALYTYERGGAGECGQQYRAAEVDGFYPRTFDLLQLDDTLLLKEWFMYSRALAVLKSFSRVGATADRHDHSLLLAAMALLDTVIENGSVFFSRVRRKRRRSMVQSQRVTIIDVDAPQWEALRRRRSNVPEEVDTTSFDPTASILAAATMADVKVDVTRMLETLATLDVQFEAVGFENQNVWICKPSNLSQGRGIHLLTSLEDILALQTRDTGATGGATTRSSNADDDDDRPQVVRERVQVQNKWVVQKYIEQPLLQLQRGRKFDVRQWVLIKSLGPPLQVFWYSKCYLRFCSQRFSLHADQLEDRFVHLSNYSVQKHASTPSITPASAAADDEDAEHAQEPHESMWCSDKFQAHLRAEHGADVWHESIVPQMQHATRVAILSTASKLENVGNGFEWLGLDFLLDENYRVWLLEVNVSPDVSHSTDVTAALVPRATEDLLELILDGTASPENGWIPLTGFTNEAE